MRQAVARILLGLVFVAASVGKIADPVAFAVAVSNYRLLPAAMVPLFALSLPWLELLAGSLCLVGLLTESCVLTLGALCMVFELALVWAMARGLNISCGCFQLGGHLSWLHVPFDLVLLALAVFVWRRGPGRWSLDGALGDLGG